MNEFIEPQNVFDQRHLQAVHDAFAYTAADPHIFRLLQAGPMRVMTLLNRAVRLMRYESKRQKLAIGRAILNRITELLRSGKLRRVKRVFVALGG